MNIDGKLVKVYNEKDPGSIPWKDTSVDIVLECSGVFTDRAAELHLKGGAKKVLISAPATGEDITVVIGVNCAQLKAEHIIVSNASCTTNCLAPVAAVIDKAVELNMAS